MSEPSTFKRRAFIAGSMAAGMAGVSAFSVWTRGAFLPPVRNVILKGEQFMTGGVPYLDVHRVLQASGYVSGIAWSKDGSRIAAINDFGRAVTVWNVDGTLLRKFTRQGAYSGNSIAFLSEKIVLTTASHGTKEEENLALTLWNIEAGSIAGTVDGPNPGRRSGLNGAYIFVLSPDGRTLASVTGARDPIILHSTQDWKQIATLPLDEPGTYDSVYSLAFSPGSDVLAAGLSKGVKLFDMKNLSARPAEIIVYPEPRIQSVGALAFSPDGRYLGIGSTAGNGPPVINAGGTVTEPPDQARIHAPIKIWRLGDSAPAAVYTGHIAPVRKVSWDASSRFLATALGDNTVRIFDPNFHEREIATSQPYSTVMSVSFSPDGKLLAAATDDAVTLFTLPST